MLIPPNAQVLCMPMSIPAELKAKNVMAIVPVDSPESIQSEIALQDDIIVYETDDFVHFV